MPLSVWAASGPAGTRAITLASTTSTENSGLLDHLLPLFERATGIRVRVVALGTGQAIKVARNGDADLLLGAYVLSDRATWVGFANKGDLKVLVEGDQRLFNPYGVILVNPARHPHVKAKNARAFIDWLTGEPGQAAIAAFRIDGRQLFFPDARRPGR